MSFAAAYRFERTGNGMTPERWRRVTDILEAALERPPSDRAAYLEEACSGDADLQSNVAALLASDREMGDFLATPAIDLAGDPPTELRDDPVSGRRIGPYQIQREIGHGGMGAVYLADRVDGQYRKKVAIKLMQSHLGGADLVSRFRNERQMVAALEHPNIARLLDGGTTEAGLPYFVMEYVDGVRIDSWCDSRKLTVRDRLKVFRNVCDAVQYAHEKQVIHRDIKPANILVTDDATPKLLDFGIAKTLDPLMGAATRETTLGSGPMTPEYASPEQLRGGLAGPASDVYALGMVLYRLLTGQSPYPLAGFDMARVASVICETEPVKPSEAVGDNHRQRRELAGDLDNIVLKALRKEPERRYRSVAELSADIDRYLRDLPVHARQEGVAYRFRKFLKRNRAIVSAATISAVLVTALVFALGRATRDPVADVRTIAVLPLENLSADKDQEYFADGITDALIGDLSRIRALRVISRTSVMSYKGTRRSLPEIARKLGVATIAEGSVLRVGNRVRISVRLVDAPKDRPIWSGTYEAELHDVLALHSKVASAVAAEIHVTLTTPERDRIVHNRQINLEAYDAYLKGRHLYFQGFKQDTIEKSIALFQHALNLDPGYAPAYAGMADAYYSLSNIYFPPTKMMPLAKAAALKAIENDNALGEAHATLALIRALYDYDRDEAQKGFQRAIELKPGDAQVRIWYGIHLAALGRFDESSVEVERARRLDPVSPGTNAYVGLPFYLARLYDHAILRLKSVVEMNPDYHHPHALLGLSYEQKGDWPRATEELEKAYRLDSEPEALSQLGHVYAASGRRADARRVLRELTTQSRKRFVAAYNIALVHAGLGEKDEAFQWLSRAAEDRSEWFAFVNVDPRLDALHADPRFIQVLRSAGLAK